MHRVRFPLLSGLAILLVPSLALAQALPEPAPLTEDDALAYLSGRSDCLSHYRFGSVTFEFPATTPQGVLRPGDTLRMNGVLQNHNDIPLPAGQILARILRHDVSVEAEHWHPIVAEVRAPGEYPLTARGSRPFTLTWPIPAQAPAGIYRMEFFYLAGSRYVFAGIPYVTNITGGSVLFQVTDSRTPAAVTFDRSSVRVNDRPFPLRAVPPTYPPSVPLQIIARVTAEAETPVPVELTTALYSWSDTDGMPPLTTQREVVTLDPGRPREVSFRWEAPSAGVYEVVFAATPSDRRVLPSILRVRFPVEGNTPRILFSGIGGVTERGEVDVVTCVVNGTIGEGTGNIATQVVTGRRTIGRAEGTTDGGTLTTTHVVVPRRFSRSPIKVQAQATDERGRVTDAHRVAYPAELLQAPGEASGDADLRRALVTIAVALVLLLGGLWVLQRRRVLSRPR